MKRTCTERIGSLAFLLLLLLTPAYASADCPYENEEARITEALEDSPNVQRWILEAGSPDFERIKTYLETISGITLPIDKIYIIEAEKDPRAVHVFLMQNGCIWFYQATSKHFVTHVLLGERA